MINVNQERDIHLTTFAKATLSERYLMPNETYQDLFARVATAYGDNQEHSQRLYDYMSQLWFMPATPVLSNGGTKRGMPISCFLNETDDSLGGIVNLWNENVWLAANGGGIGSYWGNLRSIGERVRGSGKTSGVVPFLRVQDSLTLAISQGNLRRGSSAVYMPINHPEIEEFIDIRRPTGGDPNRKTLNIHHGVAVTDKFMQAVENNDTWDLISPKNGDVMDTIKARDLWIKLLTARMETGEPYILFIDRVNELSPEMHKKIGLNIKTSNLCSEITLPTGIDHLGNRRTAVCCLSSLNLENYFEWEGNKQFITDVMRFLDNVLQNFIDTAPESMAAATYSAMRERSVGLGVMGFHSFLQKNNLPFEGAMAKVWNKRIFKFINDATEEASVELAEERGSCLDAIDAGVVARFANKTAIAPTASISIIAGSTSPGIEPLAANSFTHKTLSGSYTVKNHFLEKLLEKKGKNTKEVWEEISSHSGSVVTLDFLTDEEKDVFKTAQEIDQRWVIEHAADRTPYISQSQSVNLFLAPDIHKRDLHNLHFSAWKKGLKSLYYCRSMSLKRSENVSSKSTTATIVDYQAEKLKRQHVKVDYDECLACQ
jgi:ribonucleoside-diphosphate reductase alpha chain